MKHIINYNSSRSFHYASHPTTDIIEGVFTFKTSCGFTVHMSIGFIYAHKKSTVFPKPIIMKITNASFMPTRKVRSSLSQLSRKSQMLHLRPQENTVFPKPIITKITNAHQQFVHIPSSKFHANRTIHTKTKQTYSFRP